MLPMGPSMRFGRSPLLRKGAKSRAVLGANGAGKTTLLRTISGLTKPKDGSVRFIGQELLEIRSRLLPGAVLLMCLKEGVLSRSSPSRRTSALATLWCLRPGARQSAIEATFELFPRLGGLRHRHAASLSGGTANARTGAGADHDPRLLLLDEPSLGLAPLVTAQLMTPCWNRPARDMAVVLVEQNARSALSIAGRAVVLNLGEVVANDVASQVAGDSELRRHYLGF